MACSDKQLNELNFRGPISRPLGKHLLLVMLLNVALQVGNELAVIIDGLKRRLAMLDP